MFLQRFLAVKGAALGLAGGAGSGAADVHAGSRAAISGVIGTVEHIALDVGLGLGLGVAGYHIAVVFAPLGEAVAAGIALGVGSGAVHADPLADAQLILVVGAASDVASQIAHGKKLPFSPEKQGGFFLIMARVAVKYASMAKGCVNEQKNQKNPVFFGVFARENTHFFLAIWGLVRYNKTMVENCGDKCPL